MKRENKNIIIGVDKLGRDVKISENALNFHSSIAGKSGTGKSLLMALLMVQSVMSGVPTLVINWKNTMRHDDLPAKLKKMYEEASIVIDVKTEQIGIPIFDIDEEAGETPEEVICKVSTLFSSVCNLTPMQAARMHEAVEVTFESGSYEKKGIRAIYDVLNFNDSKGVRNVIDKVAPIFTRNLIKDGDFLQNMENIVEIDLNGLSENTQRMVGQIVLEYLNQQASKGRFLERGLNVFVDECQNLDFSEGGTVDTLINEKRKEGLNLFMATTKIKTQGKNKMVGMNQCGIQLYFQPPKEDCQLLAKWINPQKTMTWSYYLSQLERGEYVACGEFSVGGEEVRKPLILRTPTELYEG